MTRAHDQKLARLAMEVAITVPAHRESHTQSAKVPWRVIEAIRRELDEQGVDWLAARRRYLAIIREERERTGQHRIR